MRSNFTETITSNTGGRLVYTGVIISIIVAITCYWQSSGRVETETDNLRSARNSVMRNLNSCANNLKQTEKTLAETQNKLLITEAKLKEQENLVQKLLKSNGKRKNGSVSSHFSEFFLPASDDDRKTRRKETMKSVIGPRTPPAEQHRQEKRKRKSGDGRKFHVNVSNPSKDSGASNPRILMSNLSPENNAPAAQMVPRSLNMSPKNSFDSAERNPKTSSDLRDNDNEYIDIKSSEDSVAKGSSDAEVDVKPQSDGKPNRISSQMETDKMEPEESRADRSKKRSPFGSKKIYVPKVVAPGLSDGSAKAADRESESRDKRDNNPASK